MKFDHRIAQDWASLIRALATAKAPWAVVAIIGLALVLSACSLDRAYLQERRTDVQELCRGAVTSTLQAYCQGLGIDTRSTGALY